LVLAIKENETEIYKFDLQIIKKMMMKIFASAEDITQGGNNNVLS
jgi:hypothetical protein